MPRSLWIIVALSAAVALAGCAGTPTTTPATAPEAAAPAAAVGTITVSDPWIRPANPMLPASSPAADAQSTMHGGGNHSAASMSNAVTTGGYMVLANSGAEPDYLVAAAADIAEAIELHTVIAENGVMQMRPVEKIEVPASGQVELKPGGFHVMFIGVNKELKAGDTVKLTLTFEKGGPVELDAVVRAP